MYSLTFLSALLLSTAVLAQSNYPYQSGPFNLVLESSNKTLNGQRLTACHNGAAIESLCLLGSRVKATDPSDLFHFNTSSKTATEGIIVFNLPSGNQTFPETLEFAYSPASNVALPIFFPGDASNDAVFASFNKNNEMVLQGYFDDTTNPPAYRTGSLNRWYICKASYGSETYTSLAWTLGNRSPENPTCQKVSIKRVAVKA